MTCIVGVVDRETGLVYIGGDSAGCAGWDITARSDPKVFLNGGFGFGFTSSFRMGQLLRYAFTPPPVPEDADIFAYMATSFVDAVRQCLKDGGYARSSDGCESGGNFLVGFRGRLFNVEADYQVGEAAGGADAIGCGHAYAKGALFAASSLPPLDRVEAALAAAEHWSNGVRGPFSIVTSPPPPRD